MQRKAVLLGEPGAAAAAAVVEAARLAFVYQAVPPRQAYGVHQVLPLNPTYELQSLLQGFAAFQLPVQKAGTCPAYLLMLSNAAPNVAWHTRT